MTSALRRNVSPSLLAGTLAASLAACGGGGSRSASLPQPAPTSASAAAYTGPLADAKFSITIPSTKSASTARRPHYISAATASVTIALNSPPTGFVQPGTFSVTPGSTDATSGVACPASTGGYTCTIPIKIPPGSDSLTVTTKDASNNVLSQQTATFTITAGQNNTPSIVLDANTGTITVTPPGTGVALSGAGCSGSTITGSSDLSASCTATFADGSAKNFTVSVADPHGTTIPSTAPGAPALSASSSDTAKFTTSVSGSTLTITPVAGGTATITVTSTPANSSGPSPGDGLAAVVLKFSVTRSSSGTVTEFSAGISANSNPFGITSGPDGNLWFTELSGSRIGRILPFADPNIGPVGTVTEFSAGISASSGPFGITSGPDGNLWFTENNGNRIGRIAPTGTVTEFSAGISAGSAPRGITSGPDGNLWFAEYVNDRIGSITPFADPNTGPVGTVTEFSAGISAASSPYGITSGPDGNLWFTEFNGSRIGRITPTGTVTEFSAGISAGSGPFGITSGPDGNLWFTEQAGNRIGRITAFADPNIGPVGTVTEFSAGISASSAPRGITSGPDGNLWFAESSGNRIGRITPTGTVTEFSAGISANSSPRGITSGPDGNLWFTEQNGNRIGRITP